VTWIVVGNNFVAKFGDEGEDECWFSCHNFNP
jgi:hypothetical protein